MKGNLISQEHRASYGPMSEEKCETKQSVQLKLMQALKRKDMAIVFGLNDILKESRSERIVQNISFTQLNNPHACDTTVEELRQKII